MSVGGHDVRKPRLTEDIAHGMMEVAGLADADITAASERFDIDENWKQAGRAIEYIVKLARWKLAQVHKANVPVSGVEPDADKGTA